MKCYYHNDLDGRASAAIVWFCGGGKEKNCEMIEIDYKDEIEWEIISYEEEVMIVDFSFKPEIMEMILDRTTNVYWIDHHKTAQHYLYNDYVMGLRDFKDKSKSGCELIWEYFFNDKPMPRAIELIGDYDKSALKYQPTCFEFYEGLKIQKNGPKDEIWNFLFDKNIADTWVQEIIREGEIVIKYRDNYCNDIMNSFGYEIEFEGYKGFVTNMYRFGSQGFGKRFHKYDFVLAYIHDGKNYTVSMYSEKIDVSKLAQDAGKKYGALSTGGHRGASGMVIDKLPFKKYEKLK